MSTMPLTRSYDPQNFEIAPFPVEFSSDYCAAAISLCQQTQPSFVSSGKEADIHGELFHNNRLTFTEFLSDDNVLDEYECYPPPSTCAQATACSSPDSTTFTDDPRVKLEYDDWTYYNVDRATSNESCPELGVCNPASITTAPLTPIASPHDQSPVMQSSNLPSPMMHAAEREVPDVLRGGMMTQSVEEFRAMMGPIPASPPKTPGKSRGRRMSNKPTKPGTKCFECTYSGCGRVFKRSEHLKRHVRSIHTLERPFHCPFPHCSKRFSRSDNLSQHIRVHRPNGKEKAQPNRAFNNFTPCLQSYQNNAVYAATITQ